MEPEVPFFSFSQAPDDLTGAWRSAIDRVVSSGILVGGPEVRTFEEEFAAYCRVGNCVGVANGLDALSIALRALGIGPGHRVAVPGHTFIATWLAVAAVGAEPVGVDVDSRGLMDLGTLDALTPAPDAVVPVHIHGQLVDIPRLVAWAAPRGVVVVEDAAQAHGARGDGWGPGTLTDAAAFSFYPSKNLGCLGDGGGIVTRTRDVADRARELRNYGADESDKYRHRRLGVNSRLDPMQAAVLRTSLPHLDAWNARRRRIAARYLDALGEQGARIVPLVSTPLDSVWHHFVVLSPERDALRARLLARGIRTEVHYPHMAGAEMAELTGVASPDLARSAEIAGTTVSLPLHPWLSEDESSALLRPWRPNAAETFGRPHRG